MSFQTNLYNNPEKRAEDLMNALPYVNDSETYAIVSGFGDLNLQEKRVYYSLMAKYESEKLPLQFPTVLSQLGDDLMTKDGLELLVHLANVSYQFHPEWLNTSSDVLKR